MATPYQNVLNSLDKEKTQWRNDFNQQKQMIYCPECNTTLEDFLTTGFVGCANCYQVFKSHLSEFALDIHGRNMHIGKIPKAEATKAAKRREIERLSLLEKNAAESKNYILAEQYKNQIAALKGENR